MLEDGMVIRPYAFLLSIVVSVVPRASLASDPVVEFEKIVTRARAAPAKNPYVYSVENKWVKGFSPIVDSVRYDVKKTDSLVTPIVGVINFSILTQYSPRMNSKEEAASTQAVDAERAVMYVVVLRYGYRNGSWRFTEGGYDHVWAGPRMKKLAPGFSLPVTEQQIRKEPDKVPYSVIKPWLP
jgi:hypothetical protein